MDRAKYADGVNAQTPILMIEVRGVDVPVTVDYRGNFCATFGAEHLRSTSLEALHAAAMSASRQKAVKVSVPVMYRAGNNFFNAVLTGIHAGNQSLLFRFTDHSGRTKSDQLTDRYGSNREKIYRRLTESEIEKLKKLEQAAQATSAALDEYAKPLYVDGWVAVREAVKQAADKLANEEGE